MDGERARIERDLHDGAQQRLGAVTTQLRVALHLADRDRAQADHVLAAVREELIATGRELDDLANGVHPAVLVEHGLVAALRATTGRATMATEVRAAGVGRLPAAVEAHVYSACLEAVQNAAKHAGPDASVTIAVTGRGEGRLRFAVSDDVVGADLDRLRGGRGFANIADRMHAIGGTAAAVSAPGAGTTIAGKL
ncbi:sensor histidine kinase [Pseudonocardia sp. GCM10023141]|uniref:sensor histidine kinase n=1 Tax=Pseudonocardia sp. GCM10023141 TaxID=3252653 RepID=UPI003623956B